MTQVFGEAWWKPMEQSLDLQIFTKIAMASLWYPPRPKASWTSMEWCELRTIPCLQRVAIRLVNDSLNDRSKCGCCGSALRCSISRDQDQLHKAESLSRRMHGELNNAGSPKSISCGSWTASGLAKGPLDLVRWSSPRSWLAPLQIPAWVPCYVPASSWQLGQETVRNGQSESVHRVA